MPERFVLILAGGRGERFWPWSRPARPKQLLPLARGGRSLLAATFERALRLVAAADHVLVMTALDLKDAVQSECPGARVLGEPVGRNTAPAIAAAAALVPDDSAFAVLPADHAIDDLDAFVRDSGRAFEAAEREKVLVTFGVRPTGPETALGYIRRGAPLGERLSRVAQFTEKPDAARARAFVESGEYLWNCGIFVWRRTVFLQALEAGRPALARALRDFGAPASEADFEERMGAVFPGLESISVDYAVLEKSPNVLVVEASFDWDDLGSWGAWARRQPRDARGNVAFGDAVIVDCDGCVVVGEGGTAAAMGLSGMVVVHVNGATLTCPLAQSESVRRVSAAVRERNVR
ncbi:MAG TPA: sugar phosphate nucleotidyltransferase [Candidatus Eisenbacteria bacterium]|jgi:mannose-1-phosphate guanylyltransferase